ncbi:hypothetical protein DSO57_1037489, partial [Entomophthora muscae]
MENADEIESNYWEPEENLGNLTTILTHYKNSLGEGILPGENSISNAFPDYQNQMSSSLHKTESETATII